MRADGEGCGARIRDKVINKRMGRMKRNLQLISAVIMTGIGAGLLIAGFIVAPSGEIHNSVLIAFGEILTFAGSVFGIDYRYRVKS